MEYNFGEIEEKWKQYWVKNDTYKVSDDKSKPKYYVLDMFPYPSGAALHVGHPLGYVASDIYARYKRLKGFNVLHPMGFDAFGLPAEQYAIETGTHPVLTTQKAIERFRSQMDKIAFSFDWSRTVTTCDPAYYKWTQWIFLKLFGSWYNREHKKAEPIETLIARFEKEGCTKKSALYREGVQEFEPGKWSQLSEAEKQQILMHYRLSFLSYAEVNWCAALGTVLANDEVKDGRSERGGHPVERKKMRQWFLRITEYSDRLLDALDHLDWSEALKDMQRNWIGRSEGALVNFKILIPHPSPKERGTGTPASKIAPKFMTGAIETSKQNMIHAKEHRSNPTKAEAVLWEALRGEKTGYKFRRQHLIDTYIVDFVCLKKGLVIEVDGDIHEVAKAEDENRTLALEIKGFKVVRFTNNEVLKATDNVVSQIKAQLLIQPDRNAALITGSEEEPIENDKSKTLTTEEYPNPNDKSKALSFGEGLGEDSLRIFTTRPDTIFGTTFMVIAPEHDLVEQLTTPEQKQEIENYLTYVKSRTDVERQQEKKVTGAFTGSYALNPFTHEEIPIYIAEYVLAGYGTGAIMAVPADDERDKKFAEKFGLPIIDIVDKSMYPGATIEDKVGKMINSGFLDGMEVKDAIKEIIDEIEDLEIGSRKVNYKQRDAGFSRQRYWGEPFPIKYKVIGKPDTHFEDTGEHDDLPYPLDESQLPLILPEVSSYKPTGDGRSPLANSNEWIDNNYETDTMPGYAGSSWYFLRYMDANNPNAFASKESLDYWQNVDLYFGGTEHAVGHLLYARLWHKVLFDLGYVPTDEPFQKVVNQGMILGVSAFVRVESYVGIRPLQTTKGNIDSSNIPVFFISKNKWELLQHDKKEQAEYLAFYDNILRKIHPDNTKFISGVDYDLEFGFEIQSSPRRIPISIVSTSDVVNKEELENWWNRAAPTNVAFYTEDDGTFLCHREVEKMSKSKLNTIDPTDVINKYGADCFRLYEMFLGPIEQSKPWDDKGITGVQNFLRKFWRLFYDEKGWKVKDEAPVEAELKILHKTLKKVTDDIERFSYNTAVSAFMIATNELSHLNSSKKQILEPLLIALAPLAPFITEELWAAMGNQSSIHQSIFPLADEKYLVETAHNYGVSINGKVRAQIQLSLDIAEDEAKKQVLELENVKKWTNGAEPKKFIFIKGKIINIVI